MFIVRACVRVSVGMHACILDALVFACKRVRARARAGVRENVWAWSAYKKHAAYSAMSFSHGASFFT